MKATCETWETALSALVDGELDPPEQLATIDHLLDCPSCRTFYRKTRSLGELVVSAQTAEADTEPPPEELWRRIASQSGLGEAPHRRDGRVLSFRRWAPRLAAAAVLVLALGVAWMAGLGPAARDGEDGGLLVELEADRGSMTDERFMELAAEVLSADRRYHRKMLEVMDVVTSMAAEPEGSADERPIRAREDTRRISPGEGADEGSVALTGTRL